MNLLSKSEKVIFGTLAGGLLCALLLTFTQDVNHALDSACSFFWGSLDHLWIALATTTELLVCSVAFGLLIILVVRLLAIESKKVGR